MFKRTIIVSILFLVFYIGFVQVQVYLGKDQKEMTREEIRKSTNDTHQVYNFSFTKYTDDGAKQIEIEGDSADIFSNTVSLLNVVAKAYADETPVTITADKGNYNKEENIIHIEENVVATTEDGTRLLTEELDILPEEQVLENNVLTRVKRRNINIDGTGARGDTKLKKVKFKKNVTVVVKPDADQEDPTVITCDGPLEINYHKNIAHFTDNVVAKDIRGTLTADKMDVYYNKVTKKVSKIVAVGHVIIENPDGNKTYSDNVIYLAEEGRVILGGDIEATYSGVKPGML